MMRTPWWDYVERQMDAHEWSKADLSRAADVDQSVIGRWQNQGAAPEPRTVRAVAIALGRDVREAAIAAGLFTAEELNQGVDAQLIVDPETFDLSVISDERLRDETYTRMQRGRSSRREVRPRPRSRAHTVTGSDSVSPQGGHVTTEVTSASRNHDADARG